MTYIITLSWWNQSKKWKDRSNQTKNGKEEERQKLRYTENSIKRMIKRRALGERKQSVTVLMGVTNTNMSHINLTTPLKQNKWPWNAAPDPANPLRCLPAPGGVLMSGSPSSLLTPPPHQGDTCTHCHPSTTFALPSHTNALHFHFQSPSY